MGDAAASPPKQAASASISARDPRLRGWRDLLTAHSMLVRQLDDELRAEGGLSLYEYSAMLQIVEAPDRRVRMSDLADGILLTRSGVTRLIARLVNDGLVERHESPSDGRGAEAALTDEGLDRLRAASAIHLRGVEAYYLDRVSPEDQEAVGRAMRSVVAGLREDS